VWGGITPPMAKSTRLIELPRVLSPGNVRTLATVALEPKMFVVFPSLLNPSKKKSSELTFDAGLQRKPLTDVEALKSATQKSCNESGSAKRDGKGRSTNTMRQDRMEKDELVDGFIVADQACFLEVIGLFSG